MKKPVKVKQPGWAAVKVTLEDRVLGLAVGLENLKKFPDLIYGKISERTAALDDKINGLGNTVNNLSAEMLEYRNRVFLEKHEALHEQFAPRYCVIGDVARNGFGGNIGRTWKGTRQQAEDHAASILRNHPGCPELLVVQVVSKVGRKEPDIKITRV